jgi:hypothetical protein
MHCFYYIFIVITLLYYIKNTKADKTDHTFGVNEMLLATSINGIVFSLFSGQPLMIFGATGPFLVLEEMLYYVNTYTTKTNYFISLLLRHLFILALCETMYRILGLTNLGISNILKSKVNEYIYKYLFCKGLNMGASFYSYHVSQRSNSSNPFSDAIH